ncbi:hypothetical protein EV426DRAFT_109262 [Tirmania nivea]|nr:hypothetical protein EV426DRAFT_109262 [Tirmania nivea]
MPIRLVDNVHDIKTCHPIVITITPSIAADLPASCTLSRATSAPPRALSPEFIPAPRPAALAFALLLRPVRSPLRHHRFPPRLAHPRTHLPQLRRLRRLRGHALPCLPPAPSLPLEDLHRPLQARALPRPTQAARLVDHDRRPAERASRPVRSRRHRRCAPAPRAPVSVRAPQRGEEAGGEGAATHRAERASRRRMRPPRRSPLAAPRARMAACAPC